MVPEYKRRHGRHFLIPAGILIGLGVGMIVGYPGPAVLIGLGLGFVGSGFGRGEESMPQDPTIPQMGGPRWISIIIGIFIILLGIGLVWKPLVVWPYVIAIFLIFLGLWFIARGYGWTK